MPPEERSFRLNRISEKDRELLEHLRLEFKKAYNHYLKVIRDTGILSKLELEKKTTITSRRKNVSYPIKNGILANTRQCARDKAVECVRLYRELRKKKIKTDYPEFMFETVNPRLNWRDGYRINPDGSIRISVKKGDIVYAELDGAQEDFDLIQKVFDEEYRFSTAEISKEGEDYFIHVRLDPTIKCQQ